MNRCDWIGCSEIGLLDGVKKTLLNTDGKKNIKVKDIDSRFVFLCEKHFRQGVGSLDQQSPGETEETEGTN